MPYISAVLFALSANMDNVPIGFAYGIKGVRICFRNNLLIALLTSLGTLISMGAGASLTIILPEYAENLLGCGLLIAMGLWFVINSIHKRLRSTPEQPEASSAEACEEWAEELLHAKEKHDAVSENGCISTRETLVLALALMVNNLGFGVGARIAGLQVLPTAGCTFVISILLLSLGVYLGRHFNNTFFSKYTDLISGCIIIALGIYELIFS